jgi:cytochrome P450 family 142 subfamily A polypeptide 1
VVAGYDLLSPAFYADVEGMHETFRELRRQGPVWRDEANELWAVLGHAQVIEVERQDGVFSSERGYRSLPMEPGLERDMIALDDPDHAAQRSLLARRFTPRAVRAHEPVIRRIVDELIDGFVDRGTGRMDVVDDLAAPLPARLTAALIGFPDEYALALRTWSERLMRIDQSRSDPTAIVDFMGAILEFNEVLTPIVEERRAQPGDDLISVWANAELDGCPLGAEVITQETGLFISGGAETTRTVIARGLLELARHPDQWEAMAADPSLVPGAVEELIRWVTPLNNFFRTAIEPARIAGVDVAEGDRVVLLYPSANRDEKVFDDPYTFDIRRSPNPHVSFGFGTHFCLGASLARLELRLLFEQLTQRITRVEPAGVPDIEPNVFVGAVRSCPFTFQKR